MPWKTEGRSGPKSWGAALAGRDSYWTVRLYEAVTRRDLEEKIGGVISELQTGNVLSATDKIDHLVKYVGGEIPLAQGIEAAKKNLEELRNADAGIEAVARQVGEDDKVEPLRLRLREILSSKTGQEIERMNGIPSAYFELSDVIYRLLTSVESRKSEEETESILNGMPNAAEVCKAYEHFKKKERETRLEDAHDNFLRLVESCAESVSNYVGDKKALGNKMQRTAAAFQILRIPVRLLVMPDEGRVFKEVSGYIHEICAEREESATLRRSVCYSGDEDALPTPVRLRNIFSYALLREGTKPDFMREYIIS
ncbi:hypothetical protein HZB90_03690 [archaeon]|nr:hypothetical protein [archaeon]